jgi:hypothetical protein
MGFQTQHVVELKGLSITPWLYLKVKHMLNYNQKVDVELNLNT